MENDGVPSFIDTATRVFEKLTTSNAEETSKPYSAPQAAVLSVSSILPMVRLRPFPLSNLEVAIGVTG